MQNFFQRKNIFETFLRHFLGKCFQKAFFDIFRALKSDPSHNVRVCDRYFLCQNCLQSYLFKSNFVLDICWANKNFEKIVRESTHLHCTLNFVILTAQLKRRTSYPVSVRLG